MEGIGSHRERSSGVVRRRTRTTGRRNQRFDSAAADDDDSASAFDAGVDDDDEYGARGYGSADGGEHPSNGTAGTIASGADDADDSGGDREGRASRESVKAKARQGYARPSSSSLTQASAGWLLVYYNRGSPYSPEHSAPLGCLLEKQYSCVVVTQIKLLLTHLRPSLHDILFITL